MKKGPFKMKGPGVKASERAAKNSPVNKTKNRVKVSTKPASAGSTAKTAISNVAKGFSSKAKSVISQITKSVGNKVGTFNGKDVKFIKRKPGKFARSASKTAMFRGIGRAVPAISVGLLLKDMYTAGQKHSGGKVKKGQKTNTMGFGKKSIFKK